MYSTFVRFMDKFEVRENGCWEWTKKTNRGGYGEFKVRGKTVRAHRWAYATFVEPIPEDLHVLHHCDNPPCVNPSHLFTGTHGDNMRDMFAKGRHP